MVMHIFTCGEKVRYDLGGVLTGSFTAVDDLFDFLHALKENGNTFMIHVTVFDSNTGMYDATGAVTAGAIYHYLKTAGMPCHVSYDASTSHAR